MESTKEMDPVDQLKFMLTLSEHLKKLMLLGLLNTKDDSSSELAGFEISKLLTEQRKLENNYADLVKVRASLTGISNKRKMLEIQKEIMDVSKRLKESTKKLCRLFKENPDLESDAMKVGKERKDLINDLEEMISCIQNHSYTKFQNKIFSELEDQDMLRKLTSDEQKLTQEIKSLQAQRAQEQKEYQNEITEKQATIQTLKERLVYKSERADITKKYRDKESKADEGTQARIYEYKQKEYKNAIENIKSKIETETLVHAQLKEFILKKTDTLKKKADERIKLHDVKKQEMEEEKEKLLEVKGKNLEKLEKLRNDFEIEKNSQKEKEAEEKKKMEEDQENQLKMLKLENAIKLIQMEYQAWIDVGGNKKKAKKRPKKKK